MDCPDTSSITIFCGSFLPRCRAARPAAHTPITANAKTHHTSFAINLERASEIFAHAISTPASEPHVPGARGILPRPKTVAIRMAKRGLCCAAAPAVASAASGFASAFAVIFAVMNIAPGKIRRVLVYGRLGDHVFFAGPIAEIEQPAALAAKGKFRVRDGFGWRAANGAPPLH